MPQIAHPAEGGLRVSLIDDVHLNPQLVADPFDEEAAIARVAHRRRGDGDDPFGSRTCGDRVDRDA